MTAKMIPILDLKLEYEYMKEEIDKAIKRCLKHQQWILGPEVEKFEKKVAKYIGVKHCIGVASGTDALVLSLRALAIKIKKKEYWSKDDLIITTPFTFVATADAILRAGATPLFVDIDINTYNIDVKKIEEAINSKKFKNKIVGILPVHLYGLPCDMKEICEIAKKYSLFIVEDCAQSFGAVYKGKKVGSFGTLAAFSFFPSKNLGAFGDAGAVTTNDDELAELVKILRVHGGKDKYNVEHIGYKSRLDTLQAAILLVKLKYVDKFNYYRGKIAQKYNVEFSKLSNDIICPNVFSEDVVHVYHQYTIRIKNSKREELMNYLKNKGIQTAIYYPIPLHKMKIFAERKEIYNNLENSEVASKSVLSLPIEPLLREEDIETITDRVKYAVKYFNFSE